MSKKFNAISKFLQFTLVLGLTALLATSNLEALAWYSSDDWSYRKQITIDHTQVSADLTNFPVLIQLASDADLAANAQTNGADILFTDASDTKLDHEIEYFDGVTGALVAWVKVPLVSSSTDTVLYIYYGNLTAANQETPLGVWDSNYVMVHHLAEISGTQEDSTANLNHGTPQNGLNQNAAGIIDGADEFDGINQFIDVGTNTSLDVFGPDQDFSIFLWVKRDVTNDTEGFFASGSSGAHGIYFGSANANTDDLRFMSPGNTVSIDTTTGVISDTDWHYVGITADRNGDMSFWADGALANAYSIASHAGEDWNRSDDTYKIGTDRSESSPFDGILDEVRVSDIVRDPVWISTEYNNVSAPTTFIQIGPEQYAHAPMVSSENPADGTTEVSISLSELSFDIEDPDGDLMNFGVTTTPDIGSRSEIDMADGTYLVPVSGLDYGTTYTWNLSVTDGTHTTDRAFSFTTEIDTAFISNPDPQDGALYMPLNPTLSADILDEQGDSVDWEISVFLNGGWQLMDSGNLPGGSGRVSATTGGIDEYGTSYTWLVRAQDSGSGVWVEETYQFETLRDEINFAAFTDSHIGARIDYPGWDMADYMDLLAKDIMSNTIPIDFTTNLGDIVNHSTAAIEGEGLPAPYNTYENNFNAFFLDHLNMPFVPVPGNHDMVDYMGVGWSSFPQNQDDPFRKIQDLLRITEVNSIPYAFMRDNILFLVLPETAYVMTTKPIVYEYVEYMTGQFPDITTIILSHQAIEDTTIHDSGSGGYRGKQDRAYWSSLFRRNPQIKMWIHGHQHMLDWQLLDHSSGATYPVEDFGHEMVFAHPYSQADWGGYHEEDQFNIFSIAEDQIATRTWENNGAGGHYVSGYDHTWQIQTTYDNSVRDWYSYPIFIQDGEIQVTDMKVFSPEMKLELIGTQPVELFYDSLFASDDGWAGENVLGFGDDPTSEVTAHLPGITVQPGGNVVFPMKNYRSAFHEDGRTGQPYHYFPVGTTPAAVPNATYQVTLVARTTSGTGSIAVDMSVSDWGTQSQYSTLAESQQTVINYEFGTTLETVTGIYTVPDDDNAWFLQGSLDFPGSNAYEVSEFSIKRVQDTATTDDFTLSLNGHDFTHSGTLAQYEKAVYDVNPMDLAADDGVITITASINGNHYGMANLIYQAPILMSRNARFTVDQVNGNDFQITLRKDLSYYSDTFKMFPFSRKYGSFTVSSNDGSAERKVSPNGNEWIESNTPSGSTYVTLDIEYGVDAATISNESPINFAIGITPNPTLQVDIRDLQGDAVDWQIESHATGSWAIINSGTLATGDGTVSATPTAMIDYDTTYSWRVSATDPSGSGETVVETYQFTTRPENFIPEASNPVPADAETYVDLNPLLSIDVHDPDGHLMDIVFQTDASGSWQDISTHSGVGNGTYTATPVNMDQYSTTYNWRVQVNDGYGPIINTYSFTTRAESGGWWVATWPYRKEVIIDHTMVDENLSNFPVLIDITDTDLGTYAQSNGDDIVFTNEFGLQLSHEIVLFNETSGHLIAWVNVPNLASDQDTSLYLYFGDGSATNQEDITGTWANDFVLIQHLDEAAGTHYDATTYNNDSTDVVVTDHAATGQISGADEFNGTVDYVRVANATSLQFGEGSFSAEAWIFPQSIPGGGGARVVNDRGTGTSGQYRGYQIKIQDDTGRWHFGDSGIDDATGNYMVYDGTTTYSYNQWYQVVMVYDADNELILYVNGAEDGTLAVGSYGSITNGLPTGIGAAISANGSAGTHSQFFDGIIDEVKLANTNRSADWVSTSYNNQSDPGAFYTLGSLELESGPPEISNPIPVEGAVGVSVSLSQLSFDLHDPDGDLMDYEVSTTPDIGSDSATGIVNGTYTLPVSGLAYDVTYAWVITATDGTSETVQTFGFTTEPAPGPWWDSDWAYRKLITIDHTQVADDLTNFPMLVVIEDGSLLNLVQEDADDIAFTDYSGTQLDHEIEHYDPATGKLVAWVNVPSLSSLAATDLYMYFGNRESANQQDPEAVWDGDYVLIQHLDEISGSHYDSTSYGNNGTPNNLASQDAVGQIDGADEFSGSPALINVGTDISLDVFGASHDFSIFQWVKRDGVGNTDTFFSSGSAAANGIFFGTDYANNTELKFMSLNNSVDSESSGNVLPDTGWHHVGVTADRDGNLEFWVDGVAVHSESIAAFETENWNRVDDTYKLGTDRSESNPMDGILDEVRVSGILRSPGWIQTSYNNQSDPGAFYSISQEPASAYAPPTVSLVQPLDSATVEAPVSFGFIPQTYVPGGTSRAQAELWLNVTETSPGEVIYTDNSHAPQRGVIKDGNLVMVEGRDGACYTTVREFPGGTILKQGPPFGSATHSNTSVVIDGDVIYGVCTNGILQAWNQATDSVVWQISVGPGGSYSTTSNSMEVYDGHIYLQSSDFVIHKINMASGAEVDSMALENTGVNNLKAHMLVDYDNNRLYALGDSTYYVIDLATFTETLTTTIVTHGGQDTRGGPILINSSNDGGHLTVPGQYLTIFTTYPQNYTYAVDFNGNIVWTWTEKPIRAHATYNPNTGLVYVTDATGYTDAGTGLTLPGTIYALDVNDGTEVWTSHGDGTDRFSRPITASGNYLIFKTDNPTSDDYLYVLDATTGDVLAKVPAGGNQGYWCFPPALSGGYVATGGGYAAQGGNVLDIYHIGTGDPVDYYPLHGNLQHTGYVANGLTDLGFITTTWQLVKVNDTPLVDGVENTIEYDFANYTLPKTVDWKIKLVQSDNQTAWSGERTVTVNATWYDDSWVYRKAITIDHWKVPEDLTNFPVLIDLVDDDLGDYAQPGGDDILFATPSGVKLHHEIEFYEVVNPAYLVAWVNVPFVSSATDTILYMYYGNASAPPQENPTGVWDSNYVMVQHLDETSGTHFDSTGYHNDSNTVVVIDQDADGQIDGADAFNGTGDHIRVPNAGSLGFGEGSFTAQAWIFPEDILDTGGARIVNNRGTGIGGNNPGYQLKISDSTGQWRFNDASIDDAGGVYMAYAGTRTYDYDHWYQVSMVYEADDELRFYVNGVPDGLLPVGAYGNISNALPTAIGGSIAANGVVDADNKQFFHGIIDEVRLSDIPRSPGWITAEFNNQNNPDTFYQLGIQESYDPTPNLFMSGNDLVFSWHQIESDIDHFELWKGDNLPYFTPGITDSMMLASFPGSLGQTFVFTDTTSGIGNTSINSFYVLRAVYSDTSFLDSVPLGEFDFNLDLGAYNTIALPLVDERLQTADDLGAASGATVVSRWIASLQIFESRIVGVAGYNFDLIPGEVYFLDIPTGAPSTFTTLGSVPAQGDVNFTLVRGSSCVLNVVSVPLDQEEISAADELAVAIGGVPTISEWISWLGAFDTRIVELSGSNFPVRIGYPYWPCIDDSVSGSIWP